MRGLDYTSTSSFTPERCYDFQKPYMEMWLRFIGITDVTSITVQKTLAAPAIEERPEPPRGGKPRHSRRISKRWPAMSPGRRCAVEPVVPTQCEIRLRDWRTPRRQTATRRRRSPPAHARAPVGHVGDDHGQRCRTRLFGMVKVWRPTCAASESHASCRSPGLSHGRCRVREMCRVTRAKPSAAAGVTSRAREVRICQ
jgi:hypothetical protein